MKLLQKQTLHLHTVLWISMMLLGYGAEVWAQSQQDPEDLLPEINPQDIEIRGDFRTEFQGLTRQPILGFKPEPRVFQIDPNRMPYIEDEEEIVATVSLSDLEEPLTPDAQMIGFPEGGNTFARVGYGRFATPYGRLFTEQSLSDDSNLRADARFQSSDGHELDHPTSFRSLNYNADYTLRTDNDRLRTGIAGFSHFNYTGDGGHLVYPQENPPRLEAEMMEASVDWQRLYNPFNGWNVKTYVRNTELVNNKFHTITDGQQTVQERIFSEHKLSIDVHRHFEGEQIGEQYALRAGTDVGLFDNGETNQNWNYGWFGFSYYRRFAQVHSLEVGLISYQMYDSHDDLNFRFYPDVSYTYNPGAGWGLKVYARGFVENEGLKMVPETNRMTVNVPTLRNQRGWDLGVETEYEWNEGRKLYAMASYQSYDHYPFFRYTGHMSGHQLDYATSAEIAEFTAGYATEMIPHRLSWRTEVTVRATDRNGGSSIPYKEPVAVRTEIYGQPADNFYIQGAVDVRSSRPTPEDDRLSGFVLGSIQAEYKLNSFLGIFLRSRNVLNQQYELWQGYQERPLQVIGGITMRL